jgi:hypothetical protein
VTSNKGRGGKRYLPYAFAEHGALMAATVLNSPRVVAMRSMSILKGFRHSAQGRTVAGKRGDGPTLGHPVNELPTRNGLDQNAPHPWHQRRGCNFSR